MAWMKASEALTKLPELLIQGRFSFTFDGVPLVAERLSFQKRMNLFRTGIDMMLGSDYSHALPPTVQIEPTNICNLKCRLCPTGTKDMKRDKGFMSIRTFHKILDEIGDILIAVILYGWGEPFLNKDLVKMIELCSARNIYTITNTNGQYLQTLDDALKFVDAGLKAIIIAIDGSNQEIYQSYRKGGDVERVKRCIAMIEEAKRLRRSDFPYTNVRVIVTRENQEDLPNLEKLANDLGVNMFSYKTVGMLTDSEKYKGFEPDKNEVRRFNYNDTSREKKPPIKCPFPIRQPTIFWDGTVVGCEYDYELETPWGVIGKKKLNKIWNSPNATKIRKSIYDGRNRPNYCSHCPYQNRVQDSTVLSCKELRSV
jgi:radical SAM protein with 4Fe4S-binding SPASM domain